MDRNHNNLTARICPPLVFFLFALLLIMPSISIGLDCNNPPRGFGGSWARAYKNWCESCGGTYSSRGPSCNPGPNWGGGRQGSAPSYDYEAERQRQEAERRYREEQERQRQREIEEERKREEEEVRRRQEEFERSKTEALKSMKGITENELGLKGFDSGGDLGLKGIGDTGAGGLGLKDLNSSTEQRQQKQFDCEWGDMGSALVDLRCLGLDTDKPIAVDPHVVRGKERVFPAQIDPETFNNANYNKGFESLMRFDAASAAQAINYFEKAREERPNDPMVRNGLLLAQDIYKARQQKEKDDMAKAAYFILQSYASMMMGDNINARHYIAQARQSDPNSSRAKFLESLSKVDLGTYPRRKEAYQFVAGGLVSIYKQHYPVALDMIKAAQRLQPEDKFINMFLQELRKAVK